VSRADTDGTAGAILDRIQQALGLASDGEIARVLGIQRSTVGGWRARDTRPYSLCVEIAAKHGLSLDWLLTGEGKPIRGSPADARPEVPALSREEEAVLALYRALDEDARREIRAVAEEKKRLREVERALAELRAELAGAKKRA
jgi:hypothetical protein